MSLLMKKMKGPESLQSIANLLAKLDHFHEFAREVMIGLEKLMSLLMKIVHFSQVFS